ncbi:hypothetical protein ACHWQZ_G015923 [Mnemiopsis leidyi]
MWNIIILCTLLFSDLVLADEHDHKYEDGEEVVLWMNTVGPYHNQQETYKYFSLPFCRGPKEGISHYHETLGENILGVELAFSGLEIQFKKNVGSTVYCRQTLTKKDNKLLMYAIKNHYWYQMYLDDLPIWAIVGEQNEKEFTVWTHRKIEIGYNEDRIVDVSVTTEKKTQIAEGAVLEMSYEVVWSKSSVLFKDRYDKYLDASFFKHKIHWFSIFNSFMMVIFLVGLVAMILMRTLRKDYQRYSKDDDLDDIERDLGDEYGWKQIHGDVFRPGAHSLFFSTLVGTGCQLSFAALIIILLAVTEKLWTERGSILSTAIFVYAATSPVGGYMGGALYSQLGGRRWIRQSLVGASLFPGVVCSTSFFINFIAISYHSAKAIPFTSMLAIASICLFIILPLTMVGAVFGRNVSGTPKPPCRINPVPRQIPEKKWFMEPSFIGFAGGILPFGSVFIEMYFIFTSFWAYKIYYVYGFMLLVYLILMAVTICITIVCIYFLLNSEDYRWQWTSFLSAASTGFYIYLYAIYYFIFKTKMYGLFQTVFYFANMFVFSLAFGIMCGTIGYLACRIFIYKIYATVKID